MSGDELTYQIAFAAIRGMGFDLAHKILDVIPSEKEFFEMPEQELKAITGGRSKVYERSYRQELLEKATREIDFIKSNDIGVTYFTDSDYPLRFANASDAPILLYTFGNCNLNAKHIVSIVGTRRATEYGTHFCDVLVTELSSQIKDLIIVSGLAYGIDISAHRASLRNNVPTVAVQARGLNKIYPSQHRNDAIEIVNKGGMIVSDYMSQDEIHKGNFLARNRIIAALSDCTVVAESADSGGALVTANLAGSYNRDVFALPGRNSDEFSQGCNRLIKNNQAQLISCANDLIDAMQWERSTSKKKPTELELFPKLTREEQMIVDLIRQKGDVHINVLTEQLQIPVYRVMSILVDLDCRGIVLTLPGCRYAMAR